MPKTAPILITGGGSGGHIMPLLTVAKALALKHPSTKFLYLGSGNALEKQLVGETDFVYKTISTGKLRRYFSWENFVDFFRFLKGIWDSFSIIRQAKPQLIFSKGGYVSLPVCVAGYLCKVPIVMHESDTVMGLANRLITKTATRICMTFDLKPQKEAGKYVLTGSPVRKELLKGKAQKARTALGFQQDKPVILIMGGSQGAQFINELVYQSLDELLRDFQIIHICGHGKRKLIKKVGYVNYEYVQAEFPDLYAVADLVISRSGANVMAELSSLQKPNILIPLPSAAGNHQYHNARYFSEHGASLLLEQKNLNNQVFSKEIHALLRDRKRQKQMRENLKKVYKPTAVAQIVEVLEKYLTTPSK